MTAQMKVRWALPVDRERPGLSPQRTHLPRAANRIRAHPDLPGLAARAAEHTGRGASAGAFIMNK